MHTHDCIVLAYCFALAAYAFSSPAPKVDPAAPTIVTSDECHSGYSPSTCGACHFFSGCLDDDNRWTKRCPDCESQSFCQCHLSTAQPSHNASSRREAKSSKKKPAPSPYDSSVTLVTLVEDKYPLPHSALAAGGKVIVNLGSRETGENIVRHAESIYPGSSIKREEPRMRRARGSRKGRHLVDKKGKKSKTAGDVPSKIAKLEAKKQKDEMHMMLEELSHQVLQTAPSSKDRKTSKKVLQHTLAYWQSACQSAEHDMQLLDLRAQSPAPSTVGVPEPNLHLQRQIAEAKKAHSGFIMDVYRYTKKAGQKHGSKRVRAGQIAGDAAVKAIAWEGEMNRLNATMAWEAQYQQWKMGKGPYPSGERPLLLSNELPVWKGKC